LRSPNAAVEKCAGASRLL